MSSGLNKQRNRIVRDLDSNVKDLEKALNSFITSLNDLQVGDGKYPYWNGTNACVTVKNALAQYRTNAALLQKIKECQSAIKKQ